MGGWATYDAKGNPISASNPRARNDMVLAYCKVCLDSILTTHKRIWAKRVPGGQIGLVHYDPCSTLRGVETSGEPTIGGKSQVAHRKRH